MNTRTGPQQKVRRFPKSERSWAAIEFVREPIPFTYKMLTYLTAVSLVVFITFSFWAKLPITVHARGRLTSKSPPSEIRSPVKMTIARLAVKENQRVKKGEVLLTSVETLSNKDATGIRSYIKNLKTLQLTKLATCQNCLAKLREEELKYNSFKAQGDIISVLSILQDQLRQLIAALEERKQLPLLLADAERVISVDTEKLRAIESRDAQSILAKEYSDLQTELVGARTKISEKTTHVTEQLDTAQAQLGSRISEAENRLSYMTGQYTIYAPISGTAISVNVKGAGEFLEVGRTLFSIVPDNSPLVAELQLDDRDVANVQAGEMAEVQVEALPEYEYGLAEGKVYEVVRMEDPDKQLRSIASASFFYAHVELSKQTLSKKGVTSPLLYGMTVTSNVVVRYESVFNLAMRTLFRLKDDLKARGR